MSNPQPNASRSWQVLLIGGNSCTGKTSISYRLAHYFGVGLIGVEDFWIVAAAMTTPEQQPTLHYLRTHPEAVYLSAEEFVEHKIAVGKVMKDALGSVIANHLESQTPVVLEGDFILPALAIYWRLGGMPELVKAVFLVEDDETQLRRNYRQREPEFGEQSEAARVSWLYGQWLTQEVQRVGVPVVPARPWETIFERVIAAIE